MLLLAALALTACSVSTVSVKPRLDGPPLNLTAECKRPVRLPEGTPLRQAQVEGQWGRDRKNLVDCAERHRLVVNFYRTRDALLAGKPQE